MPGVRNQRERVREEPGYRLDDDKRGRNEESRDEGPARLLSVYVHVSMLAERANATVYVRANAELPG